MHAGTGGRNAPGRRNTALPDRGADDRERGGPGGPPFFVQPKGTHVRTTIGAIAGRRGEPCAPATVEETLARAQRVFADVAAFLETEIDRLFMTEADPADEDRLRTVRDLITKNQQALRTVLEIEARLGREGTVRAGQMLDLEAAREEIARRLARLAA